MKEHKISYDREVVSVFMYADWSAAAADSRVQYIEIELDDGSKVKVGTETAAATSARTSAPGTIVPGALFESMVGVGRFVGLVIRPWKPLNGTENIMGAQVIVNTATRCDIANAIYVSTSSGNSFVGEVYKDTIT